LWNGDYCVITAALWSHGGSAVVSEASTRSYYLKFLTEDYSSAGALLRRYLFLWRLTALWIRDGSAVVSVHAFAASMEPHMRLLQL